jgi:hypothetical protein
MYTAPFPNLRGYLVLRALEDDQYIERSRQPYPIFIILGAARRHERLGSP